MNEAYLRLVNTKRVRWESRAHFLGVAAQAMRRILVDAARARATRKRGGDVLPHPTGRGVVAGSGARHRTCSRSTTALDDAGRSVDPRKSRVVELRYFGGLTEQEAAAVLRVSTETVQRDWRVAKVWLLRELSREGDAA